MDRPTITLYSKSFARTGWINDPVGLKATPRHNGIGTAVITIPTNHRRLPLLLADGARVVIEYRGEKLITGGVEEVAGTGPRTVGLMDITIQDDFELLSRMLGWPVPGAAINAQGTKKDTRTGPAETVLKAFVNANKAHLIDPITVATNLARGSSITASIRMTPLSDALVDMVDKAGVGISVKQSGSGLLVDCYTPTVYPHTLSEDAGTITSWSFSRKRATTTRAVVGGPNEDTSREFRLVTDSARETASNRTVEAFVDARSADNNTEIDKAGTDALAAAGPKSGFSITMSETSVFTYGGPNGVHVGDQVTVDIGGVSTITDVLREAELVWTRDDGLKIAPQIGDHSDDPDRAFAEALAAAIRGIKDLRTR